MKNINFILNKFNNIYRHLILSSISNKLPVYLINEYPKSGGTWAGQMISEILQIDFPRNRFPSLCPSIFHGHYLNNFKTKRKIIVWRDGRDVMVSWYYHCLFYNEHGNDRLVNISRDKLLFSNYNNIYKNLPKFIEYAFTIQPKPGFSWTEFVDNWHNRDNIVYLKYELLNQNTINEMSRVCFELTGKKMSLELLNPIVEKYSFEKLSKRKKGEEMKNSFLRKGIVGDWKNSFSREACEIFSYYANDALLKLNYETDESWVEDFNKINNYK
jgi:hypothetical protein